MTEVYKRKKIRKARKPMSPEQKEAAAKRLAEARAKRQAANPPQYKNIHHTVRDLDDDHALSMKNVKEWIKTQKEIASTQRAAVKANVKGALARLAQTEGYIRYMQSYLQDGIWRDSHYGEHREMRMGYYCVQNAYDENGEPKRTIGIWYQDLGGEWTYEMEQEALKKRNSKDG